jgi:hypothetical protein
MRKVLFVLSLVFLFRLPTSAQDTSKIDLVVGASFVDVTGPAPPSLKVHGAVFSWRSRL